MMQKGQWDILPIFYQYDITEEILAATHAWSSPSSPSSPSAPPPPPFDVARTTTTDERLRLPRAREPEPTRCNSAREGVEVAETANMLSVRSMV
jgi:hypothetical protein